MKLGFLGVGVITSALVEGLCTADNPAEKIVISPRNKDNATNLAARFDVVEVATSNQAVIDVCDTVVLAVLPQDKEEILGPLNFRADQVIIHLLAGIDIADVAPLVSPATTIVRSVPLPCAAKHIGPIALYPHNPVAEAIFSPLGNAIFTAEEKDLVTLSVVTGLMAPYFAELAIIKDWAVGRGVDGVQAAAYTASMFGALSALAEERTDGDLMAMALENMTPGGLNARAMQELEAVDALAIWPKALDAVQRKIDGEE